MRALLKVDADRFARCIAASKRVRWEIDDDVIRGRLFYVAQKFLPDNLTLVGGLNWLSAQEKRYLGQVQGRTYANMFGLVERFIGAKILDLTQDHWLGDQTALEALVRFSDEELKHQELFRRVESLIAESMPPGYRFAWDANAIGSTVLSKSSGAVLALTMLIELFTQVHYRESIEPDQELSPLFKDIFLFHWKEESQHAILDELEWRRVDASLTEVERDKAIDDLIELVGAIDGVLQGQAASDCEYFIGTCRRQPDASQVAQLQKLLLEAYRSQYIFSGAEHPGFVKALNSMITTAQSTRIGAAIATLR